MKIALAQINPTVGDFGGNLRRIARAVRRAEEGGILLRPSDHYVMVNGHAPNAVRMALAGDVGLAQLETGLRDLAGLLGDYSTDMAV